MDLRQFIVSLEEKGYLKRVKNVTDWKYEIGSIARKEKNNAILFENIKDYNEFRLFTGGLSGIPQIAIALGLEPQIKIIDLIKIIKCRAVSPILPKLLDTNPFEYKTFEGNFVNLYDLPVPWWNELDRGRYIGTWHINVTKSYSNYSRNVGVYRMEIVGKNQTTVSVSSGSDLAAHMKIAETLEKDLELAVAVGVSETIVMAAAAALPRGNDEFTVAGGFEKKAIELIKCKTVDLEVPLTAEIVMEGVLKKNVRIKDGPYFDYTGTQSINPNAYLFEIRLLKYRNRPIFRGMSVGVSGAEDHILFRILSNIGLVNFHGSRVRQRIQNVLLKKGYYRLFQKTGKIGKILFR